MNESSEVDKFSLIVNVNLNQEGFWKLVENYKQSELMFDSKRVESDVCYVYKIIQVFYSGCEFDCSQ